MKKLGQCLARLRRESGLSIREAARQSSLTPSYLSKLEAGDTFATISIKSLVCLGRTYRTPLLAILTAATFVSSLEYTLPEFAPYLRLKYELSQSAIRDMEMALEIVERKYAKSRKDRSR